MHRLAHVQNKTSQEDRAFDQKLCHRDEPKDVGGEHGIHICVGDVANALDTQNKPGVVHCTEIPQHISDEMAEIDNIARSHPGYRRSGDLAELFPRVLQPARDQRRPVAPWRSFLQPVHPILYALPGMLWPRIEVRLRVVREGSRSIQPIPNTNM